MTGRTDLMIGEFARRCRLPVSTLRYYDRIGLLTPALVDPGSGYRRYTPDQLAVAVQISRLRSLGIAPDRIARVVAGGAGARSTLLEERRRLAEEVERGGARLRVLDALLVAAPADRHRVDVVELTGHEVIARPFRLPVDRLPSGVPRAIAALRSALRRRGRRRWGTWGATFPVDLDEQVSGFVYTASGDVRADGGLDTGRLPGGRAVAVVHRGDPADLPLAYDAVFAALDELGAEPVGPVIEEYPTLGDPAAPVGVVHLRVPFRSGPPAPSERAGG